MIHDSKPGVAPRVLLALFVCCLLSLPIWGLIGVLLWSVLR